MKHRTQKIFLAPAWVMRLAFGAVACLLGQALPAAIITTNLTTPGSGLWLCPLNVSNVTVECWGGGGAGGSAAKTNSNAFGGGGAGGAYARKSSVPVTPGNSYGYTVGAGGVSSTNNGAAVSGTNTIFTGDSGVAVVAAGGAGGMSVINSNTAAVGAGGFGGTNGCVGESGGIFAGGSGAAGLLGNYGGGGGGAGGNANPGGNASGATGGGGGLNGGGAGANGPTANNPGTNGIFPGGGGSGARASSTGSLWFGGNGAAGQISVTYVICDAPPVPTIASVVAPACSPVIVNWAAVSNGASYNIYRKLTNAPAFGAAIGSTTTTNYLDGTTVAGSNYVYAVSALSACGTESARSANSPSVTSTGPPGVVTGPANVTGSVTTRPQFSIVAVNALAYQWQVNKGGGFANCIETLDGTGSTNATFTAATNTLGMNGWQFRCVVSGACSPPAVSSAATLTVPGLIVNSLTALQAAIDNAQPGDIIIVSNGVYQANSTIYIGCVGTSNFPIIIKAQTVGGVTIGGGSSFDFIAPAAWTTVQGFFFTNAGSQIKIEWGTSNCRLTRNLIQCTITNGDPTGLWYAKIAGDDAQFDRNELRNKNSVGQMLRIDGDGVSQIARRVWVHHNYFHDNVYQNNVNGVETVRWGLGIYAASSGEGMMEYNLLDRCDGDAAEMISNKSCNNTYRFNTFLNATNDTFKLRTGTNCVVNGNCFSNTPGLTIWNYWHLICNNYFINNSGAIEIGNGDTNVLNVAGDASHTTPRYCVIAFNTLINNAKQYWMDNQYVYGAQSNTFANNIVLGSAPAANFLGTYANGFWTNNIIWNSTVANTSPGNMPAGAYTKTNPLVTVPDAWGVLHLQSNSPAIAAAAPGFSVVTNDLDGQPRPAAGVDIGADERSNAPVTAHFLTPSDVGPLSVEPAVVVITNLTQTYDGTGKFVSVITTPAGISFNLSYNGSPIAPTNAGSYTVVAVITDPLYSGGATNTLNIVTPIAPQFGACSYNSGAGLAMSGTGPAASTFRILATTNLLLPIANWTAITTDIFSGGTFNYTDTSATNFSSRYYRIVTP